MELEQTGLRIEVGDVYRDAWGAVKATLGPTAIILGVIGLGGIVVPGAIIGLGIMATGVLESSGTTSGGTPEALIPMLGIGAFAVLLLAIVMIVGAGALNALYLDTLRGRPTSVGIAFSRGFSRSIWLFVAGLCVGLGTGVGVLMCCVPGIIFALGMSLVNAIVMEEDIGPVDALQRSWDLTNGHKVDIFLIMLVFQGLNMAVSLVAMMISAALVGTVDAIDPSASGGPFATLVPQLLGQGIQMALSIVLVPLQTALFCAAYARRTQRLGAPATEVAQVFT